jgi:preprotein translocase SecE subunit
VTQTTGKSRKEECLLSQQDAEKTCVVITEEKAGAVRQIKDFPEFLAKVRQEMKLVHHPGWQQVRSTTLVVIVFVFLFAFYLHALDWIFSPLDRWLFVH